MTESDLLELRAALTQLAKALEIERACVLRVMRLVEKQMTMTIQGPALNPVPVSERDSLTTVGLYTTP